MRKILIAGVLLFASVSAKAAINYEYSDFFRSGNGQVIQSTVSISSITATIFDPQGSYAELKISTATAQYYYRIDGGTLNIREFGWPVIIGESPTIQSINGFPFAILSATGTTAQTLRYMLIKPK